MSFWSSCKGSGFQGGGYYLGWGFFLSLNFLFKYIRIAFMIFMTFAKSTQKWNKSNRFCEHLHTIPFSKRSLNQVMIHVVHPKNSALTGQNLSIFPFHLEKNPVLRRFFSDLCPAKSLLPAHRVQVQLGQCLAPTSGKKTRPLCTSMQRIDIYNFFIVLFGSLWLPRECRCFKPF